MYHVWDSRSGGCQFDPRRGRVECAGGQQGPVSSQVGSRSSSFSDCPTPTTASDTCVSKARAAAAKANTGGIDYTPSPLLVSAPTSHFNSPGWSSCPASLRTFLAQVAPHAGEWEEGPRQDGRETRSSAAFHNCVENVENIQNTHPSGVGGDDSKGFVGSS